MSLEETILELGFTSEQGKLIRDNIISGKYVPISAYNELSDKFKSLKVEADTARDKLLGVSSEADRAKSELKAFKQEIKMQSFNRAVDDRIANFAREQNVEWNDTGLVRSLIDLTTVKEMENGMLFGLDEQLGHILSEKSFLARAAQNQDEYGQVPSMQTASEVLSGYDNSVQGIVSSGPGTIRMSPQSSVSHPYADASNQQPISQQQQNPMQAAAQYMINGAAPASRPVAGFTPQQVYQQAQVAQQAGAMFNPMQSTQPTMRSQFAAPSTQVAMEEQARALSIAKMRGNGGLVVNPR
jgi:hypothetical protein